MAGLEVPESARVSPACILLVYGIPGSGKTVLTTALLQHCRGALQEAGSSQAERDTLPGRSWNVYGVHFDEFYPPDTRGTEVSRVW